MSNFKGSKNLKSTLGVLLKIFDRKHASYQYLTLGRGAEGVERRLVNFNSGKTKFSELTADGREHD